MITRTRLLFASSTIPLAFAGVGATAIPAASAPSALRSATHSSAQAPTWTPPMPVDPAQGAPTSISCASPYHCVAVDAHGDAFIWNGAEWSAPRLVVPLANLTSVSCPSPTFCVAIGSRNRFTATDPIAVTYDGLHWSRATILPAVYPSYVSCPSTTFCVAVASDGHLMQFDGATWSVPQHPREPARGARGISCATSTFCAVVAHYGDVSVFDGSHWSRAQDLATDLHSVSCPVVNFCAAVGEANATMYDGTSWSTPQPIESGRMFTGIACATSTFCAATGAGVVSTWSGGTWQSRVPFRLPHGGPAQVACASVDACMMVDATGHADAFWSSSGWAAPVLFDPPQGVASGISCLSSTFCMVVDRAGGAVTWNGHHWSAWRLADPNRRLIAVSCPTTTFCAAVDDDGSAVTYDGSTWSAPQQISPVDFLMYGVTCPTTTFCMADGYGGWVETYDGTSWSSYHLLTNGDEFSGFSCASPTFCMGTSSITQWLWNGSTWSNDGRGLGQYFLDIDCLSSTWCMGGYLNEAGTSWGVSIFDGTGWGATTPIVDGYQGGVESCMSTTDCLVAGTTRQVFHYDGTSWSGPQYPGTPSGGAYVDASCPVGTTFCAILDQGGRVSTASDVVGG